MRNFNIGDREIGENTPCYIVFEAGPTITGLDSALKLAQISAEAGADAIKFQILDIERLMGEDFEFSYKILKDRKTGEIGTITESYKDIIKRRVLSKPEWVKIKNRCDELSITFFSTVDFPETVDFMVELGCHTIKMCSGDLTHFSLIQYTAKTGLPIMIDSGNSTINEIEKAVEIIEAQGNGKIIIHNCPSGYPARLESINLNLLTTLRQMFDYPIAFSDHTPGWDMDIAAVAMGSCMVEKTITLDKTIRSCEHMMSLEPNETKRFVKSIRELETAMGNKRRIRTEDEYSSSMKLRRSMFAKNNIEKGQILEEADIDYRRPGIWIRPEESSYYVGRIVTRNISKGEAIKRADFS